MSNIEQRIIENEIEKSLGNDFTLDKALDLQETILKGKKAQIGEIREWSGGKYRKTSNGWERIKESGKNSRGSQDNGINDNLQVNRDTTASKKGENPMKVPEGVNRVQYENIILDRLDRPSIHPLTINGKELRIHREIDRSGGQFTPYYQIEGGDGKKYWDLDRMIENHRNAQKNKDSVAEANELPKGWEDRGSGDFRKKYSDSPIHSMIIRQTYGFNDFGSGKPALKFEVTVGETELLNERESKAFYEKSDELTSKKFSSIKEAAEAADKFVEMNSRSKPKLYSGSSISRSGLGYNRNLLNALKATNSDTVLIPEHKLGSWRETENAVSGTDWKVSRSIGENGEWEIGGKYYKFTKR